MGILEALIIAASGFLTVFFMLVLLWFIIQMINKAVTAIERKTENPVKPSLAAEPAVIEPEMPAQPAQTYGGEIALYDVDEKTAACIMAIISDETKIPLNQLIFRSIRAMD
ncbi:MAG: OadG family protein [Solobacterium sp.]|nr:OadG family protein [Solobacterium sp.]